MADTRRAATTACMLAPAARTLREMPAGAGLACLCLLFLLCAPMIAWSADVADSDAKLQQLQQRIRGVKQELSSMRGQRDTQQTALERTEKEIGKAAAALHRLEGQAEKARDQIRELRARHDDEQLGLQTMRAALALELRAAYVTGRQERIKLLLNQEDPAFLGRMLVYHGYLSRARAARMQAMRTALRQLQETELDLQAQQAEFDRLQAEQREKTAQLAVEQDKRRAILVDLQSGLKEKSAELSVLEQDEQRLQKLVQSLRQAISDIPAAGGQYKSIRELKGKLHWPVPGKILTRYGAKQASGKLSARGVFIAAASGAEVHAIAKGRVVFADWLRGFGLLLIIDHGGGYMSLYGHNSSLYKGVGDRVDGHEVVAAVGSSGGRSSDGLYLELRKDGRPFDPAAWFKGTPQQPTQASR